MAAPAQVTGWTWTWQAWQDRPQPRQMVAQWGFSWQQAPEADQGQPSQVARRLPQLIGASTLTAVQPG
jgi:hypothetical protein